MKISIVMGFFLPMPPDAGGATEKSWHRLAIEFAKLGHEVTVFSRKWTAWPDEETIHGVRHVRLAGFDHTGSLPRNLLRDLVWSIRVFRQLPPADITIVNSVTLPIWLGPFRRNTGKLVLMPGRLPKGQFRLYRKIDMILAVSKTMKTSILAENGNLEPLMDIVGYPIDWSALSSRSRAKSHADATHPITIGYIGRIHREKGLDLLVGACEMLAKRTNLPAWKIVFCGPKDVSLGGSGATYAAGIERRLSKAVPTGCSEMVPPIFQVEKLARLYHSLDIFCYPSIAAQGETFGVAVAEAMASGAVPVVSKLPCFHDYVRDGENGIVFDHTSSDAALRLADILAGLIADNERRNRLATQAQATVKRFDFPLYASHLLGRFATLTRHNQLHHA